MSSLALGFQAVKMKGATISHIMFISRKEEACNKQLRKAKIS